MLGILGAMLLFSAMLAALAPSSRVQQMILAVLGRGLRAGVMVAVATASVFYCWPQLVPDWLLAAMSRLPLSNWGLADETGVCWLPLAGLIVLVALPPLAMLDFARRLTTHSRMLKRMGTAWSEIGRQSSGQTDSASGPQPARAFESRPSQPLKSLAEFMD